MNTKRQSYPSDLTDAQWDAVRDLVPAPRTRRTKYDRREILNAWQYVEHTGCQWRAMPHDLPHWSIVYWYIHAWRQSGALTPIRTALRAAPRRKPTAAPQLPLDFNAVA